MMGQVLKRDKARREGEGETDAGPSSLDMDSREALPTKSSLRECKRKLGRHAARRPKSKCIVARARGVAVDAGVVVVECSVPSCRRSTCPWDGATRR